MLHDLRVYFFIEFAKIKENRVHFLQLLDNEVALVDHWFYGDASADEHLVYCDELCQLFVVDELLELFYFILETNH